MRIFTFSGIRGAFSDINRGETLIQLARDLRTRLTSEPAVEYEGLAGSDHFISEINWSTLVSQIGAATLLDGSPVLNAEALRVAPVAAAAMRALVAANPREPVLILAHSQGTNNATFTLHHLLRHSPGFFAQRAVRCLYFDPKVGPNHVRDLFIMSAAFDFPFLFLQSEQDLLSNQGVFGTRFIEQFPHGNHLYVAGLDHSDILDFDMLAQAKRRWLTLLEYQRYMRAVEQERIRIAQQRGKPGWTTADALRLDKFKKNYQMNAGALIPGLVEFSSGKLSNRYKS
jgi:pimeloyl-ACP methyl ester carboxylesterase